MINFEGIRDYLYKLKVHLQAVKFFTRLCWLLRSLFTRESDYSMVMGDTFYITYSEEHIYLNIKLLRCDYPEGFVLCNSEVAAPFQKGVVIRKKDKDFSEETLEEIAEKNKGELAVSWEESVWLESMGIKHDKENLRL